MITKLWEGRSASRNARGTVALLPDAVAFAPRSLEEFQPAKPQHFLVVVRFAHWFIRDRFALAGRVGCLTIIVTTSPRKNFYKRSEENFQLWG